MVSNKTQHPQPLSATHYLNIYTVKYFDFGKGEGEPKWRLEGLVENTNMTNCIFSL